MEGTSTEDYSLPRRYTLTHSDLTGDLFLSIGRDYDWRQVSGFYTRLMRDEVLAEWMDDGLHVYCHVSGGIILGSAAWRNDILHHHMPMVLETFRYGEEKLVSNNPGLAQSRIWVHFGSNQAKYDRIEDWGVLNDYKYAYR